jgi:hypothetical protein
MTLSRLLGRKLNILKNRPVRRLKSEVIESQQNFETEILQKLENVEKLSIRELRELRESVQGGNQTDVDEFMAAENLGYFHMKDDRMAKVDPERHNYAVSRGLPGHGDMNEDARKKFNEMNLIRLIAKQVCGFILAIFGIYCVYFGGFILSDEYDLVKEDPSYAMTWLKDPKWKGAMEAYYKSKNEEIPWKKRKEIRFD